MILFNELFKLNYSQLCVVVTRSFEFSFENSWRIPSVSVLCRISFSSVWTMERHQMTRRVACVRDEQRTLQTFFMM